MSRETDILVEAYSVLKEYVPTKERQGAADALMSIMVDALSDPELKELSGTDAYLRRSYEEYCVEDEDEGLDYED